MIQAGCPSIEGSATTSDMVSCENLQAEKIRKNVRHIAMDKLRIIGALSLI
jgi:hypothetical protein